MAEVSYRRARLSTWLSLIGIAGTTIAAVLPLIDSSRSDWVRVGIACCGWLLSLAFAYRLGRYSGLKFGVETDKELNGKLKNDVRVI